MSYRFFGFQKEPFPQNVPLKDIYPLPGLTGVAERFTFALKGASVMVITGDVGTGKSTSLRYATASLHPSAYRIIPVIANASTTLETIRLISFALDVKCHSHSLTVLTKTVRDLLMEIVDKKQTPVIVIDEAHLMRFEVFAQLHTLLQFDFDSRALVPLVLCGFTSLVEKLKYHTSRPLASRVMGKSHLEGLNIKDMAGYLTHHLKIAGIKEQLFSEEAVLSIQQNSGGLLRRANALAKGSLMAADLEECPVVSADHVRVASTELI